MMAQLIKTCNRLAYKNKGITVFHHCVEIKKQYYGSLNVYCIDNKNFWRVVKTNVSNKVVTIKGTLMHI